VPWETWDGSFFLLNLMRAETCSAAQENGVRPITVAESFRRLLILVPSPPPLSLSLPSSSSSSSSSPSPPKYHFFISLVARWEHRRITCPALISSLLFNPIQIMAALSFTAVLALSTAVSAQSNQQVTWAAVIFNLYGEKIPALKNGPYNISPLGAQQSYSAGSSVRDRYSQSSQSLPANVE
jgi:hypothetical protein